MAKWIKNDTGSTKTYLNQDILAGAYYEIQPHETISWANDSTLITDIGSADAIVSTTNATGGNITDVNTAVNYLKGNLPTVVSSVNDVLERLDNEQAYVSTTDLNSISGTSEHNYMLITNPSSSGKKVMITHFSSGLNSATTRSLLRVYSTPTITTNGTALTVVNTYIKTSPISEVVKIYKDPTISARGTLMDMQVNPSDAPSRGMNRYLILDEGKSLLCSMQNSVTGISTFLTVYFLEV